MLKYTSPIMNMNQNNTLNVSMDMARNNSNNSQQNNTGNYIINNISTNGNQHNITLPPISSLITPGYENSSLALPQNIESRRSSNSTSTSSSIHTPINYNYNNSTALNNNSISPNYALPNNPNLVLSNVSYYTQTSTSPPTAQLQQVQLQVPQVPRIQYEIPIAYQTTQPQYHIQPQQIQYQPQQVQLQPQQLQLHPQQLQLQPQSIHVPQHLPSLHEVSSISTLIHNNNNNNNTINDNNVDKMLPVNVNNDTVKQSGDDKAPGTDTANGRIAKKITSKKEAKPLNSKKNYTINFSSAVKLRKQCPECGKVCSRPSTLKTHYLIHTGDTPFKCTWDNCGKSFNVKSNMLRHMKSHQRKLAKEASKSLTPIGSE